MAIITAMVASTTHMVNIERSMQSTVRHELLIACDAKRAVFEPFSTFSHTLFDAEVPIVFLCKRNLLCGMMIMPC